jgi:HEAT repeat protein
VRAQNDGSIEDAVKELSKQLKSPELSSRDEDVKFRAVREIKKKATAILKRDPKNSFALKILVDFGAAYDIGELAPDNREALKALIKILEGNDYDSRLWALAAVRDHVEFLGKPTLPHLEKLILHKSGLGENAGWVLIKMGPAAKGALPTLLKAMRVDPESRVADYAAVAVIGIDPKNKEAKDHLEAKLRSWSSETRIGVAKGLMAAPIFPESFLELLLQALERDNRTVKNIILTGLPGSSQTEKYLPFLAKATREPNFLRLTALESLAKLGKKSKGVIPDIIACLSVPDAEVRVAAANALGSIGPDASRAIRDVRKVLDDPVPQVREAAAKALKSIEKGNKGK